MDKTLTTSSMFAVAVVAATMASPASASILHQDKLSLDKIAVDSVGNLMVNGVNADDALALSYGLSGADAELAATSLNIGKCTITNNCACGGTPPTPTPTLG